jgi:hypothetical protein
MTETNQTQTTKPTGTGRFDYVKYDETAIKHQELAKVGVETLAGYIEKNLHSPRAKALALTKLEEVYMWVGKAIRDDQVTRNGGAPLQEQRNAS